MYVQNNTNTNVNRMLMKYKKTRLVWSFEKLSGQCFHYECSYCNAVAKNKLKDKSMDKEEETIVLNLVISTKMRMDRLTSA